MQGNALTPTHLVGPNGNEIVKVGSNAERAIIRKLAKSDASDIIAAQRDNTTPTIVHSSVKRKFVEPRSSYLIADSQQHGH